MGEMRRLDESYKRIIIAGGGQIGERLAEAIESKLPSEDHRDEPGALPAICPIRLIARSILQGSSSDRDLLIEENIAVIQTCFLALTNDDEANIMSSLLAKRLGARRR